MPKESSFDVVSEFDRQELVNALDVTRREIANRYDLKNSNSTITLEEEQIVVISQDEYKLRAVLDVMYAKAVHRNLSMKIFDPQKIEPAAGGAVRQTLKLREGLTADQCRELNKLVRDRFKKVKTQIQGDALRISDKSKDALQEVIVFLKQLDFEAPLQFTNYR